MPSQLNERVAIQVHKEHDEPVTASQLSTKTIDDWSDVTKELVNSLPQVWTRGLLYFLLVFVSIVLPWSILFKVDETGKARGRLEPKGTTIRLDAPVTGTVEKINIKEGEFAKAGQSLVELESDLVRAEFKQQKSKLEGQQNRLQQLEVLQKQLATALSTQWQQNRAQHLEKQAQVEQAQQNLNSLKNTYNLEKKEKLAQLNQEQEKLEHSKKAYKLENLRLNRARKLVQRYREALQQGIVAEIEVIRHEDLAQERQQLQEKAKSDIKQGKLHLEQQESTYKKTIGKVQADIKQAQLRLKEQESNYQSLIRSGELAVLKSKEQLKNVETEITTLKSEITQNKSQIKSLQFQLDRRVLEAPVSGTVFQLPVRGKGVVVQTGSMVAEIAPEGTPLVLRAQMATAESGFLKEGMVVKMKFDAYPFQDYGVLEGKLVKVSPTSKVKETDRGQVAAYELEIELNRDCIPKPSGCVLLRPGDTATAEVIIRQRRVIDFLIDPFKKLQQGGLEL